jgi:hypothetical protein
METEEEKTQSATAEIVQPEAADVTAVPSTESEVHPAVGLADGALINGEKIVYERDAAGEVVGWHKERLNLQQMAELGDASRPKPEESEAIDG